ncbi:hypothetical protein L195_g054474, partial [Trifolium pratense]
MGFSARPSHPSWPRWRVFSPHRGHDGSYRGTMEDLHRIFCVLFKSSSCHDDKSSWYDGKNLLRIFFNLTAFSSRHAGIHRV